MALFSKEIIGLDIGHNTIKIIRVQPSRKSGGKIKEIINIETGLNPEMSTEESTEHLGQVLSQVWKENKLKTRRVITCVPGKAVFSRQLKIPIVTGDRLNRIIRYEAKQQIPFPLDQVLIDYRVFGGTGGELEVTLVAIKRDIISDHTNILKAAKLRPDIIDVSSLCLFNTFLSSTEIADDVTALVNIGASSTDIIIEQGQVLKFMRSAQTASGNALTNSIAREFDVSFTEAESMKVRYATLTSEGPGISSSADLSMDDIEKIRRIPQIIENPLENIVSEVRRSIDFYVSQPDGMAVSKVLVTGGTTRIPGIEEFISERLGIPTERAPMPEIPGLDCSELSWESVGDQLGVSIGLALRTVNSGIFQMNFIPPNIKQDIALEQKRASIITQGVLILALTALLIVFIHFQINLKKQINKHFEIFIKIDEGPLGEKLATLLKEQTAIEERFKAFNHINQFRGKLSEILIDLPKMVPDQVWVTSLSLNGEEMDIGGKAEDEIGIDQFVNRIRLSAYCNPFETKIVDKVTVGDYMEFKIKTKLKSNVPPWEFILVECLREAQVPMRLIQESPEKGKQVLWFYSMSSEDPEEYKPLMLQLISATVDCAGVPQPDILRIILTDKIEPKPFLQADVTWQDAIDFKTQKITWDEFYGKWLNI